MSMPGFTAMVSLEKATYRYVSGTPRMVTQGVTGVVPSLHLFYDPKAPVTCDWPCRMVGSVCFCP
ncbi:hypothetical protein OKW39_008613 [Paraburkholderia sp. MM6662-R1]